MDYLRKENESLMDYGLRLIEYKIENKPDDLDWQDIVDLLGLDIHRDTLRKSVQSDFGGYKVYKYMLEKSKEKIDDNDLLKNIEEKRKEFEMEKIKFQDQKREYRKYLRQDARWEHLKDVMVQSIKNLNKQKELKAKHVLKYNDNQNEATLILSDFHSGLEVDNYWNVFNLDILKQRMNELLDKTINHCRLHKVKILHVEILGDMINGLIHTTSKIFSSEDAMTQTQIISELLCEFLIELANNIEMVKIYSCTGNHGRGNPNKKEEIDTENFERLIPWYLKARLKNINNIKIVDNKYDDEIITYKVFDKDIIAVHGHRENLNNIIDDLSQMLRIFPYQIHLGHYHKNYQNEKHDIHVIVNGCLSGVDQYAKLKRYSGVPHQKLIIYDENGELCQYKIVLN